MNLRVRSSKGPIARSADGAFHTAEGDEIFIEVEGAAPGDARISGARISPTSVAIRGTAIVTGWSIPIHTWAGRAEIELTCGASRTSIALDIAPHPGKLGLDAFREMLDELVSSGRDLPWGLSPGALPAAQASDSPAVVHPSVLEHELPALLSALAQLRQDPLTCTLRTREVGRLRHARHVDARSTRWLAAHPRPLLATVSPQAATSGEEAVFVEQRRTERSLAHPATAHVRFLLERLLRLLRRSAEQLATLAKHCAIDDREHASWLAGRVERASEAVSVELSRAPLSLVMAAPATEGATQVIVDHPVYGRVQRIARRLLDPGLNVSADGSVRASARRTHELYELMVLFRFVDAAKQTLGRDWTWQSPEIARAHAIDALRSDAVFMARGPGQRRLEIRYQPTFASYSDSEPQKLRHALSGERRPDTIAGLFEGEVLKRWIVLDAKYRASRSAIHDGLADVHVYRDALRWAGKSAAASFIVIPACDEGARIYTKASYLGTHGFGAVVTSQALPFQEPLKFLIRDDF